MTGAAPPPQGPPPQYGAAPQAAINDPQQLLHWAFILSLVGGIVILLGSVLSLMVLLFVVGGFGFAFPAMMMGGPEAFGMAGFMGVFLWMLLWGIAAGVVVLIGAYRLRADQRNATPWGIAILVAAGLSMLTGGGFGLGAILALVGGVLALLAARPPQGQAQQAPPAGQP